MAGLATVLILVDLVVSRKGLLATVALVGLAVPLGFTIALWRELDGEGAFEPVGIFGAFTVDKFSLFFSFLFIGVAALVVLISTGYVKKFHRFEAEFYALVIFSVTGMMLLASTLDLITIYISLELTALPLAALAAFSRDSRSSESGMKFLILSAISSAVLLYGMVLVYGLTGSTSLPDIAAQIKAIGLDEGLPFGNYALLLGIVLIIAGFGFKLAIVPFQMWVPDVYEGSPTPVTAFLSVASKAAGFAIILRVFYSAFAAENLLTLEWSTLFAILSALSMTFGNLVAIAQNNIKRLLAYSTVAHAGYLLVGLAAVSARVTEGAVGGASVGPSAVLFYLGAYAATNLAVFSAVIAISNRIGSDMIDDYAGMGQRAPYLAAALALGMVSLIGVPPTVGFMAKVYIFGGAVNADLNWLVVAGVINSVLSAYYYLRVVKVMYLLPPSVDEPVRAGIPEQMAIVATVAGVAFFGIYPTPLLNMARTAAEILL